MFYGSQSIDIKSNYRDVYDVAQSYPYFVRFFSGKSRQISNENNQIVVEVHTALLSLYQTKWTGVGEKKPHNVISFIQTEGLFKDLKALWIFTPKDNCTRVTIKTLFKKPSLTKFLSWILGYFVVEKTTRRILKELKFAAENQIH